MRRAVIALGVLLVPAVARAGNQCQEVSDVVGERRCSKFGFNWSTERSPPLLAAIGAWSSFVRPPNDAGGTARAYGLDLRLAGYFVRHGYVGFDFGFGLGRAQSVPAGDSTFVHARVGPVIGVRVPLGRVALRFETLTALQVLLLGRPANATDGTPQDRSTGAAMLAIEPRIAFDVWLTPDTTLSAWGGTNVLRTGDMSVGLTLAAHVRAFDGAF